MNRRHVLVALATGALGIAGCLGQAPNSSGDASSDGSQGSEGGPSSDDLPGETTPTAQFQYDARNSGVTESAAPATADVRWRTRTDPVEGGLPVADGRVVVAASGNLVAIDADTGDVLWDVRVGHGIDAPPALTADTAYLTTWNGGSQQDRGVAAIDLEDGSERWRREARERQIDDMSFVGIQSPPAVANGVAYVASHGGDVYAIAA